MLLQDLICSVRRQPFSEKSGLLLNRCIVLGIAAFLLLYGLWYQAPGRVWDYLSITANIYLSSIFVLLVACCYWKGARAAGGIGAIVGGALPPLAFLLLSQVQLPAVEGSHPFAPWSTVAQWLSRSEVSGLLSFAFAASGMILGSWMARRRERNQLT